MHSEIIYAHKSDFLNCNIPFVIKFIVVSKNDIQILKSTAFTVDRDEIVKRIKDHKIGKRLISEAILDATKLNC